MRTHPFGAKVGIWHQNPENVKTAIERQLNAGHVNISMEAVESPQEVRDVIKAMRLTSAGGTRPETGLEKAADYCLSVDEDKKKADVWPLNKNGELLITVIIESIPGLEKAREIARSPEWPRLAGLWNPRRCVQRRPRSPRNGGADGSGGLQGSQDKRRAFPVTNTAELQQRMKEGSLQLHHAATG